MSRAAAYAVFPFVAAAQAQTIAWNVRPALGPSARYHHAMAYDAARGVTVLFGGLTPTSSAETWEWNGSSWSSRSVSGPSARNGHGMVFDPARGETLLFGGWNYTTLTNDTWAWNGTAWTQRATSRPPTPGITRSLITR